MYITSLIKGWFYIFLGALTLIALVFLVEGRSIPAETPRHADGSNIKNDSSELGSLSTADGTSNRKQIQAEATRSQPGTGVDAPAGVDSPGVDSPGVDLSDVDSPHVPSQSVEEPDPGISSETGDTPSDTVAQAPLETDQTMQTLPPQEHSDHPAEDTKSKPSAPSNVVQEPTKLTEPTTGTPLRTEQEQPRNEPGNRSDDIPTLKNTRDQPSPMDLPAREPIREDAEQHNANTEAPPCAIVEGERAQIIGYTKQNHARVEISSAKTIQAAMSGKIVKMHISPYTGRSLYLLSADGTYCLIYGNLETFAENLAENQTIDRCKPIGEAILSADRNTGYFTLGALAIAPGQKWWLGKQVSPDRFISSASQE